MENLENLDSKTGKSASRNRYVSSEELIARWSGFATRWSGFAIRSVSKRISIKISQRKVYFLISK